MPSRRSALLLAGTLVLAPVLVASPAVALKPPVAEIQEVLIKASLMSFNDANLTGNYAVLHAKLSNPFRDQIPPEKLKQTFKPFVDAHVDFDVVVAKPPVPTEAVRVDDDGRLLLRGYFDTQPSRVHYDLAFIMSEGEWKLIRLNVNVKKLGQ